MEDLDGRIAGSLCLQAGLHAKDLATARSLFRAACRYFGKGVPAHIPTGAGDRVRRTLGVTRAAWDSELTREPWQAPSRSR